MGNARVSTLAVCIAACVPPAHRQRDGGASAESEPVGTARDVDRKPDGADQKPDASRVAAACTGIPAGGVLAAADGTPIEVSISTMVRITGVTFPTNPRCASGSVRLGLTTSSGEVWTLSGCIPGMPRTLVTMGEQLALVIDARVDSLFSKTVDQTVALLRNQELVLFTASAAAFGGPLLPNLGKIGIGVVLAGEACPPYSDGPCGIRSFRARVERNGQAAVIGPGETVRLEALSFSVGAILEMIDSGNCDGKSQTDMSGFVDGGTGTGGAATRDGGANTGAGGAGTGGESCELPWFGSLKGAAGLLSCPAPYDPALFTYGQQRYEPCSKFTGPIGSRRNEENLSCCYTIDESACGTPYLGELCTDLWYFGDGRATTTIPDKPVGTAFEECAVPFGTPILLTTQAERAAHLVGVWLKCRGDHPWFSGNGFVFRADGTYHGLQTDAAGRLFETTGCDQSGLWGFIPNPNQLNMSTGGGYLYYFARFVDGARRHLRLEGPGNLEFVSLD